MFSVSAVNNAAREPLHGLSHSADLPWEPLLALLRWILARKGIVCILWFLAVASCRLCVLLVHHMAVGPVAAPGHTHAASGAKGRFFN